MILTPDSYPCPQHQIDLTAQVLELLDEDGPPGAKARRPPVAYGRRPWLGKATAAREFEIIVVCPGTGGAESHNQVCHGTYTT